MPFVDFRFLAGDQASGELENTIVLLVSDNGASGEGGPNGSVNENKFFNGIPDDIQEKLQQRGIVFAIAVASDDLRRELDRFGVIDKIGPDHYYDRLREARDAFRNS